MCVRRCGPPERLESEDELVREETSDGDEFSPKTDDTDPLEIEDGALDPSFASRTCSGGGRG